jgi:hypothetical protein
VVKLTKFSQAPYLKDGSIFEIQDAISRKHSSKVIFFPWALLLFLKE